MALARNQSINDNRGASSTKFMKMEMCLETLRKVKEILNHDSKTTNFQRYSDDVFNLNWFKLNSVFPFLFHRNIYEMSSHLCALCRLIFVIEIFGILFYLNL